MEELKTKIDPGHRRTSNLIISANEGTKATWNLFDLYNKELKKKF